MSWQPCRDRLVTYGSHGSHLWGPGSTSALHTLQSGRTFDAQWSPVDDILATADKGGKIHLWEPATGRCLRTLEHSFVWSLAFSPGGLLARGDSLVRGLVVTWSLATGRVTGRVEIAGAWMIGGASMIDSLCWNPWGDKLAARTQDKGAVVLKVQRGEERLVPKFKIKKTEDGLKTSNSGEEGGRSGGVSTS